MAAANAIGKIIEIDDATFVNHSILLDLNSYWPLTEDVSYAYMAETEDECEFNKLTVLPIAVGKLKKMIDLVQMRVVRGQEWAAEVPEEGESTDIDPVDAVSMEDTFDYYGIDDEVNI